MKEQTEKRIKKHFGQIGTDVIWPRDLSRILIDHRVAWDAQNLSTSELTDFLVSASVLKRAEFSSPKYRPITRYLSGNPSPFRIALALRRDSFLSHATALVLHRLEQSSNLIYVNQEQSPKSPPEGMTQSSIMSAFKNPQRKSHYVFQYEAHWYVLLSGKNTSRAGVVHIRTLDGETVDSTDLERTLIDIVVRPAYAGGLKRVLAIYRAASRKVDVDHLIKLLNQIGYAYPYQQSIGFLLERSGQPEKSLQKLEALRTTFDFFLDYGLKQPSYDKRWRLFYPATLGKTP